MISNQLKFIGLLTIFLACNLQAQTVEGKVLGGNDQLPLPYVNISVLGTNEGTITNDDGMFELNYTNKTDSIEFSFLGYSSKIFSIEQVEQNPTIILDEEQASLSSVTLQLEPDVDKIIQKMIENIGINYPSDASINTGYVKEVARENGKIKRIIESGLELYVPSYLTNSSDIDVRLLNLKTNVETFDRFRPYGNFNNITRSGDIYKNVKFLVDVKDNLAFEKVGRTTLDDKVVYEIKVVTKNPIMEGNTQLFYEGKLWIEKQSYALVTMDITQSYYGNVENHQFISNRIKVPFKRQLLSTRNIIRFKELSEKWYLGDAKTINTLMYTLDHTDSRSRRGQEKLKIEIADIFVTTDLKTDYVRPFRMDEKADVNKPIYLQAGVSDEKVWNKIHAIKYTQEEEDYLTKYAN